MARTWVLAVVVVLAACPAPSQPPAAPPHAIYVPPPTPPAAPAALMPPEPALRLPKNFQPTHYRAELSIDPAATGFTAAIEIAGTVVERSTGIWLHGRKLRIATVALEDSSIHLTATAHGEDLLLLTADRPIEPGPHTISITYAADYDLLNTAGAFKQRVGKDEYIYSQLEAIYARRVFPCVDEPDSKVPWQLGITTPKGLLAVANTPETSATDTPDGHRHYAFAETHPLPSYLVAFGVGPFEIVDAGKTKGGTPVRIIAIKGRAADAAFAARTSPRILEFEEDWFGMAYPYPKLDFLTIPITVGFSAMENAGLITFTERDILLDAHASREREHRWIYVAAHELAHQWFGDLVTMAWWDDIWLNEGFANWLEHKISARYEPSWHDELSAVAAHRSALVADKLVTARRVRQPIATPGDILTAFDGITYNKGQSILDMFEAYVGPAKFQEGVRAYLHAREYGTATSQDFAAAISKVAGKDLAPALSSFLDQGGEPEITATLDCANPRAPVVQLAQRRYLAPGAAPPMANATPWIVPVCVAYDDAGKRATACTLLDAKTGSLALPANRCPRWLAANEDGRGYYRTNATQAQLATLRDEAWPLLTWPERMTIAWEAREGALEGRQPLALAMSFVPKLLAGDDRFTVADATAIVKSLEPWVPADLRAKWEQWLRATYGPAMARVGLAGKQGEDIDGEQSRASLVEAVAWIGRDAKLADEAVRMFDGWRDLPGATRRVVVQLAVDAKPEIFDRALADVYVEHDRARRGDLLHALATVRDGKRQVRALGLVLDARLDIRETLRMLEEGATPAAKLVAQQFFRDHAAAILARLPTDETADPIAHLGGIFTASCDGTVRDATAAYVTQMFGKLGAGAPRIVAQQLEALDHCVAARALVEPELRGWLGGVRIPKPAPPPKKAPVKTSRSHRP